MSSHFKARAGAPAALATACVMLVLAGCGSQSPKRCLTTQDLCGNAARAYCKQAAAAASDPALKNSAAQNTSRLATDDCAQAGLP